MTKIEEFETLARNLIGDGLAPNLFFVSVNGMIVGIVSDEDSAYAYAQSLDEDQAVVIEDRVTGVLWENRFSERQQASEE